MKNTYTPMFAADAAFDTDLLESGRVYYRTSQYTYEPVCNVRSQKVNTTLTGNWEIYFGEDWETLDTVHPDRIIRGDDYLWVLDPPAQPEPPISEAEALIITSVVMRDTTQLPVVLEVQDAYLLIAAIQQNSRHPKIHPLVKKHLRLIADSLAAEIAELHPRAGELLELGWNPAYDRRNNVSED